MLQGSCPNSAAHQQGARAKFPCTWSCSFPSQAAEKGLSSPDLYHLWAASNSCWLERVSLFFKVLGRSSRLSADIPEIAAGPNSATAPEPEPSLHLIPPPHSPDSTSGLGTVTAFPSSSFRQGVGDAGEGDLRTPRGLKLGQG